MKKMFALIITFALVSINIFTVKAGQCSTCGCSLTLKCDKAVTQEYQGACANTTGCKSYAYTAKATGSCSGVIVHKWSSKHAHYYKHDKCSFYNNIGCSY